MFQNTITALKAVEGTIREEWKAAKLHAPIRGCFEDTYPQVVAMREELERHAARPEIAAIEQNSEVS